MENKSELVEFAADIVAAYVGNNSVPATELPSLINDVIRALNGAVSAGGEAALEEVRPAVPIKKSVTPDYIICLEDGKKFKSLKRHLRTHYDLTPERCSGFMEELVRPAFVLLGTGREHRIPPEPVRKLFADAGIGIEPMSTGAAARTYNVLLAEGRDFGAGLIAVD